MAGQARAGLAGSVASLLYRMYAPLQQNTRRALMDPREEHVDNKYRCTPNCIGKATTSITLRNERDPTMSGLPTAGMRFPADHSTEQ